MIDVVAWVTSRHGRYQTDQILVPPFSWRQLLMLMIFNKDVNMAFFYLQ